MNELEPAPVVYARGIRCRRGRSSSVCGLPTN